MKFTAIIPARFHSTRLEGKVLLDLAGKPLIQHVYEAAKASKKVDRIVIATDDERISAVAESFGAECFMSAKEHENGSSRCFEAFVKNASSSDVLLNLQGDEPFLQPQSIDALASLFENQQSPDIATLIRPAQSLEEIENDSFVKAIRSENGKVHWFSRAAIPYVRDENKKTWLQERQHFIHLGLYGFKASIIKEIQTLSPSPQEKLEKLEQLRWLENGYLIKAAIVQERSFGIDTKEDLEKARELLKSN